jgi:hypothetical protein
MRWKAQPIWNNRTVYIVGGGPSVAGVDLCLGGLNEVLQKKKVIAVNNSYQVVPDADICFWSDMKWWNWHWKKVIGKERDEYEFSGLFVTCNRHQRFIDNQKVLAIGRNTGNGISTDPRCVKWNKCSGGAAISLAYLLGSRKIVLIGYDMQFVQSNGKRLKNFHNDHKEKVRGGGPFKRHMPPFHQIRKDANRLNVEIINTTIDSALNYFTKKPLTKVLEEDENG